MSTPHVEPAKKTYPYGLNTVMELFDVGPAVAITVLTATAAVILFAIYYFIQSAPPSTITISSGPEGSMFQKNAQKYADILKRNGVKLKVLTSKGSFENLQRLADPKSHVDIGMAQAGITTLPTENLVSLGSIAYQPLLVFYRGSKTVDLLSELTGKQIAIGPEGSGSHDFALALLKANGITDGGPTKLLAWPAEDASKALLDRKIDAAFIMSESASMTILHDLLRSSEVHLMSFRQASAYSRKNEYLNILTLPEGSIDLGLDIPPRDLTLLGPTVELVAVKGFHPALSDLMLEAAVEVHGKPGIFQKRGEFPADIEHAIRVSDDANRYYKSGKSLAYRYLPFWLASLLTRVLVAFIPILVVLIPALRAIPALFRWKAQLKIRRHYKDLLALEKRYVREKDPVEHERIRREFDRIDDKVNRTKIQPAFADQFYALRGHIAYVRSLVAKSPTA